MSFEEWWKLKWIAIDFPDSKDELEELIKSAYRAGLLHAAEQDLTQAGIGDDLGQEHTFETSAAMHRQAASEVK